MGKPGLFPLLFLVSALLHLGCAAQPKKVSRVPEAAKTQEDKIIEAYLRQGAQLEKARDPVAALEKYRLALTIDPSDQRAVPQFKRVREDLLKRADDHYQRGLAYHKIGKYALARQEFLQALRLQPDHREVINFLTTRKRVKVKRYIAHQVKEGETLSQLSERYYGDYRKFPIIANYNNIPDATYIHVGQSIRVPEVEGLAFRAQQEKIFTEKGPLDYKDFWNWEEHFSKGTGDDERNEMIKIYIESGIDLFNKKKYEAASREFGKVIAMVPEDKIAREYSYRSNFQLGMIFYRKKAYMEAMDRFAWSLKYNEDCVMCHAYKKKCEDEYKELHYNKGVELFAEEKLIEAIEEWEKVKALDPNFRRVDYSIHKAKTMLRNLDRLKQNQ